jgi:hypothetical protein
VREKDGGEARLPTGPSGLFAWWRLEWSRTVKGVQLDAEGM